MTSAFTSLHTGTVPEPDQWYECLARRVSWKRETLSLFGRTVMVPRQVAWFGDAGLCYRYSNTDHHAHGWPPELLRLRDWLSHTQGVKHNFVLLNRYRDGNDYMGWHADDEPGLLGDVCSISLGAERRFLLEPVPGQRHAMTLAHGSVMTIPRHWRHCLPRTRRCIGPRINLSFRSLQ